MDRRTPEQITGSHTDNIHGNTDPDQFRLLEAETVIFDKFDEVVRRKQHVEPEKGLMFAILEEGISCFQKHLFARTQKGKNLFREAEAWILERDSDDVFSFENICDTLGLSPNYLRAGLIAWKNQQLQRVDRQNAGALGALEISPVVVRLFSAS